MKILISVFATIFLLAVFACGNASDNKSNSSTDGSSVEKSNEPTITSNENKVPAVNTVTEKFVTSNDGLIMRDKPDVSGKAITVIPFNSKVVVLQEKIKKDNILKISGYWVNVKWGNYTGFCFDGFLK